MASLDGVLASIPGYGGYLAKQRYNEQQGAGELQQVGALVGLQQKMQAAQKEAQFQEKLSKAKTLEERVAVAEEFSGAQGILQHADRRAAADQTKQLAMSRLSQQIQKDAAEIAHKARTAQTSEEKFHWQQQMDTLKAYATKQSAEIAAGRYNYDTGMSVAPFQGAIPQAPAAPAAPAQAIPSSVPASDAEAFLKARAGGTATVDRIMSPEEIAQLKQMPAAPQPAPVAAPAPAPLPNDAANLDARDLQARGVAPKPIQAPAAAPAAPAATVMPPEIARLPKRAQDAWAMAQAKQGQTGGTASDAVVTAIIDGRMQMPTGFALRSPYWQDVIERVAKQDPKFDASRYAARAASRRTFASGPEARNVTALNTVIGHLGTLDEAAQALHNNDIRVVNTVMNRMATEFGDPRIQNFDTAKQAVAEETMRVFRQVGASEAEARAWGERITASGSPAQLRGVIGTLGKLLESRVEAIGQQYERSLGNDNPARVDPANQAKLDKLVKQGEGAAPWDNSKEQRYQELKRRQGGGS